MILLDGVKYRLWKPPKEEMLEKMVREHSKEIWGENSLYFGKKKLRTRAGIGSIPDGYVVVFENPALWYIVEVELSQHPRYEHVLTQVSKFAMGMENIENQRAIVDLIETEIASDEVTKAWVKSKVGSLEIYKFLTALIAKPPRLDIIIDEKSGQFDELVPQLRKSFGQVETMEFKTYKREGCELGVHAHLFEPLHETLAVREAQVVIETVPEVSPEEPLSKTSPDIHPLFFSLRKRILSLGEDIREVPGRWWIDYRKSSTFVSPNFQKKRLVIYIKMGDRPIVDPEGWTTKVTGFGRLNTKFIIDSANQLDYAMSLIQQAYDYVP